MNGAVSPPLPTLIVNWGSANSVLIQNVRNSQSLKISGVWKSKINVAWVNNLILATNLCDSIFCLPHAFSDDWLWVAPSSNHDLVAITVLTRGQQEDGVRHLGLHLELHQIGRSWAQQYPTLLGHLCCKETLISVINFNIASHSFVRRYAKLVGDLWNK